MSALVPALLATLTVQRSGTTFVLHEAGKRSHYSTTIAVLLSELVKQLICWAMAMLEAHKTIAGQQTGYVAVPHNAVLFDEEGKEVDDDDDDDDDDNGNNNNEALQPNREAKVTIEVQQHREAEAPPPPQNGTTSFVEAFHTVSRETFSRKAWMLSVPAGLYVLQNNLFLFAAARLEPNIFQAAWQIRLLPTAYLASVIVSTPITQRRWACLFGLSAGIILLECSELFTTIKIDRTVLHKIKEHSQQHGMSSILSGSLALIAAALLSALATVLLEKIYISKDTNLWIASSQMSMFSILPSSLLVIIECTAADKFWHPFHVFGTSLWPWNAVMMQSVGGILVGLITKFVGSVANGMSGVASIALTTIVSLLIPNDKTFANPTSGSITAIGISVIAICTYLYAKSPTNARQTAFRPLQHPSNDNHNQTHSLSIDQRQNPMPMSIVRTATEANSIRPSVENQPAPQQSQPDPFPFQRHSTDLEGVDVQR